MAKEILQAEIVPTTSHIILFFLIFILILRNSPIIILDEATASVDVQTEKQIQAAISQMAGKRTIIAIAHRLSTIINADLILVIHEGRIVEQGTHQELLDKKGFYYEMQKVQL